MYTSKFIAELTRDAREAILLHRADYEQHPENHRGCLWCDDERMDYWLSNCSQTYGDDIADAVLALYERAYGRGYTGIM